MRIDVNALLGKYPWRDIGEWDVPQLVEEMDRSGITEAWVSSFTAIFSEHDDPTSGNRELFEATSRNPRLRPIPTVMPGSEDWEDALDEAALANAPAIRCDPGIVGLALNGAEMRWLADACTERGLPLLMAVRFEDVRQRDPADGAQDLPPWAVRTLIRSNPSLRLIVTHADREFVEQVHFGSTPSEAARILWDICWIWGPPEDHLATLLRTVGVDRFTFGTGMPLRMPMTSVVRLDLLDIAPADRAKIEESNLRAFS